MRTAAEGEAKTSVTWPEENVADWLKTQPYQQWRDSFDRDGYLVKPFTLFSTTRSKQNKDLARNFNPSKWAITKSLCILLFVGAHNLFMYSYNSHLHVLTFYEYALHTLSNVSFPLFPPKMKNTNYLLEINIPINSGSKQLVVLGCLLQGFWQHPQRPRGDPWISSGSSLYISRMARSPYTCATL